MYTELGHESWGVHVHMYKAPPSEDQTRDEKRKAVDRAGSCFCILDPALQVLGVN